VELNNVHVNWDVQIIGMVSGYEEIGVFCLRKYSYILPTETMIKFASKT
jgi:hypothetical protein